MRCGFIVCLLAACGGSRPAPVVEAPRATTAVVDVAEMSCPPTAEASARLHAVLAAHRAEHSDLVIRVKPRAGEGTSIEIELILEHANGEVGLERTYTVGAQDCASTSELLALGVDRFLSSFPEWAGPPRPPPSPPVRDRWLELAVVPAVTSIWVPLGVEGQVGALVDRGARGNRFGVSLLVRGSVPQAAGSGRFQQTALLAGATWRRARGSWSVRAEARGGALLVSGIGYAQNASDFLPWWEGAVFGGRTLSWGTVGIEIAATGLRHKAVTRDGLVKEDIPLFRVGLAAELGVASQKP